MSAYRDELDACRARLASLEAAVVDARRMEEREDEELAEAKAEIERVRRALGGPRFDRRILLAGGLGALAIAGGAAWLRRPAATAARVAPFLPRSLALRPDLTLIVAFDASSPRLRPHHAAIARGFEDVLAALHDEDEVALIVGGGEDLRVAVPLGEVGWRRASILGLARTLAVPAAAQPGTAVTARLIGQARELAERATHERHLLVVADTEDAGWGFAVDGAREARAAGIRTSVVLPDDHLPEYAEGVAREGRGSCVRLWEPGALTAWIALELGV